MYATVDWGTGPRCGRVPNVPSDVPLFNIFNVLQLLAFSGQKFWHDIVLCNVYADKSTRFQYFEDAKTNYPVALVSNGTVLVVQEFNDKVQDRKVFELPVPKDTCVDLFTANVESDKFKQLFDAVKTVISQI